MKTIVNKKKKQETVSNPYNGKVLDPKVMLSLLGDNEKYKWHATFCKILLTYKCPKYSVATAEDGNMIVHVTNKHGYSFNICGSGWSFICLSAGKYMKDYFEMKGKEDAVAKMKAVIEAFRKMNQ